MIPDPADLEEWLGHLDDRIRIYDASELAAMLVQCRDAKRALTDIEHTIEDALVELLPSKRTELEGMVLEVRGGAKRNQWKVDELMPLVFRHLIDPDHTGELPEPAEIVERLRVGLPDVVPMTPGVSFKVGGVKPILAAFGHDIDEYCVSTPGRKSVQVTRSAET